MRPIIWLGFILLCGFRGEDFQILLICPNSYYKEKA